MIYWLGCILAYIVARIAIAYHNRVEQAYIENNRKKNENKSKYSWRSSYDDNVIKSTMGVRWLVIGSSVFSWALVAGSIAWLIVSWFRLKILEGFFDKEVKW
jgi:hypothetical protein